MKKDISTREFCTSDIEEMAELTVQLGYKTNADEMANRMSAMKNNSDYKTIVAVADGKVIGYIGMIKLNYWEKNGCYIKIQALVVSNTARKSGAGRLLIKSAEKWGAENKADLLALTCGNKKEREEAHKFYPKMGFVWNARGYVKVVVY